MDVREKLVELMGESLHRCFSVLCKDCKEFGEDVRAGDRVCQQRLFADYLLANGVTVQEWISVKERLPDENENVMIWDGGFQVAKIEKGITDEERTMMKNGEIDDPVEIGWNTSDGYFSVNRSESYRACDKGWNNDVPYCWHIRGGGTIFGQNVTCWMPLPEPPKGE